MASQLTSTEIPCERKYFTTAMFSMGSVGDGDGPGLGLGLEFGGDGGVGEFPAVGFCEKFP